MDIQTAVNITAVVFGMLLVLMASGMWISMAMALTGLYILVFLLGGGKQAMIGPLQFNALNGFTLTAVPLFIFMGEIIFRGKLSEKLYKGANNWVGFLPGGLLHTNILACALFAAISGSSVATAATVGTVALPELEKRKYGRKLVLGSLAAGGTLGILIPPSLPMIVYGAMVNESVGRLFLGGVIPGILLAGTFMTYIAVQSMITPEVAPDRIKFSLRGIVSSFSDLWPIILLIFMILGTIYLGIATPTEAAALGASLAFGMVVLQRKISFEDMKLAALSTLTITSWIALIVVGAQIMANGLSFLNVPQTLARWIGTLPIDRLWVLAVIVLVYIVLGMFLEALSMQLLTIPLVYPIIRTLGFDGIWFGVVLVILIEMAQISPPVGVNLFVIHGMSGKKYLNDIMVGIVPFFLCMLFMIGVLTAFPDIVLWLPTHAMGK